MAFHELLRIWREADELGYYGASLYDLLTAPCLECWTALTALTARTARLRAVPLVLSQSYRHPGLLAKMAATLDLVSGGRLVLGIGAGGAEHDHRSFALQWLPAPQRIERLEDAVRTIRFLWSGDLGTYATRHYGTVTGPGVPTPTRSGPPILIGGHGEKHLLRVVARLADVSNIGFDLSLTGWKAVRELLERYCAEEGRAPGSVQLGHNATVIVGHSDAAVRAGMERYARLSGVSVPEAERRLAHALVGRPEECIVRLQAYMSAGVTWFFLFFPDLPDTISLRLFALSILPALYSG
jgi:alkanesulfonate monooxygenase SsuD/methylene tetrahydromethanopterin reductase-like flavin-dependent oxidoreductase (luciferase family)